MSLGNMLGGAMDIHAIIEALKNSGGNIMIINPGQGGGAAMPPDMMAGAPPAPPMPEPPMGGPEMISNGAPPAMGPDVEGPAEDLAEGGIEEPTDMLSAAKAGLAKGKSPTKGPPKAPSKGVGKGPAPGANGGKGKPPAKKDSKAPAKQAKDATKKGK